MASAIPMDSPPPGRILDCAVIGGGPAGLTAAVYLGRSRRSFAVFDTGQSRARWIPTSHNTPGFPEGVHGGQLLTRLREQAAMYGPRPREEKVEGLAQEPTGVFRLNTDAGKAFARTVILATGVRDLPPPELDHLARAVKRGLVRSCPICDAYEATGKSIGVLGSGDHAAREALFLRTYSDRVSVLLTNKALPSSENLERLAQAGIPVIEAPVTEISQLESGVRCAVSGGEGHPFDVLYSALGISPNTALAAQVGAELTDEGRVIVDDHMRTTVGGLYAAGDVVRSLNQIAVCYAEAAIAAVAIHNSLDPNPA